jgi:hypothetical protein
LIPDGRLIVTRRIAVAAAAMALAACATAEQALLERFFDASRLRDTTALQTIATVIFEPRQQGIIRTFEIVAVGQAQRNGHAVKDVTLEAPVFLPDGRTVHKRLVVTIERNGGGEGSARWLVTGFRDVEASPSAPPS